MGNPTDDESEDPNKYQVINGVSFKIHPLYKPGEIDYDIGILLLKHKAIFNGEHYTLIYNL